MTDTALPVDIAKPPRSRSMLRAAVTLTVAALVYEALARSGWFAAALLPTLPTIWQALLGSLVEATKLPRSSLAHRSRSAVSYIGQRPAR